MTLSPAPLPANAPVPVPADQAVYLGLRTDHYPWTEVTVDLATRQGQHFSGVFDAWQGDLWARFVWASGTLLGGHTRGGQVVAWTAALQALPRAHVSLTAQEARLARLVWAIRSSAPGPLPGHWPEGADSLAHGLFSGAVLSDTGASYWAGGQAIGGALPRAGAAALVYPAYPEVGREALSAFWQILMPTLARSVALDSAWHESCTRLSRRYPCLDPFAQEIVLRGERLHIDPDLPLAEMRPALLAALLATLYRLGLRLEDLPISDLRARPEWAAAGLETP